LNGTDCGKYNVHSQLNATLNLKGKAYIYKNNIGYETPNQITIV